jgi:hypothetical protein
MHPQMNRDLGHRLPPVKPGIAEKRFETNI